MKLTKKETLKINEVAAKLRELGITEYLVEPTKEQVNKAIKTLDFEELTTNHPQDQSITVEMIGVFYKGQYLGARAIAHKNDEVIKEIPIQSKEYYEKQKQLF